METRTSSTGFAVALLLFSGIINVLQARQIKGLRLSIAAIKREGSIQVGDDFPAELKLMDLGGKPVDVRLRGRPAVIYILQPGCKWCTRNVANMKAVRDGIQSHYRFVPVSLSASADTLKSYLESTGSSEGVLQGLPNEIARRIGGTPTTVVVSDAGKVLKVWAGAYSGGIATQVEQYFGLKLPGLAEGPTMSSVQEGERPGGTSQ